jgi:hypothetical protein
MKRFILTEEERNNIKKATAEAEGKTSGPDWGISKLSYSIVLL